MPQLINDLWAIFASISDMIIDTGQVARTYGLEMVTLADYIEQTFQPVTA